jgi:hypothetical protein
MAEPGTLERLAQMLGEALSGLADEFTGDDALDVLTDLGLQIPPDLVSPALRSAISACATSAQELPALVEALIDAVEADADGLELAATSAPLLVELVGVIDSFDTIAHEVGRINLGVLPAALTQFVNDLPKRLLDRLLVRYLSEQQPIVSGVLTALGVLGSTVANPGSTDPITPETEVQFVDFARIGAFFTSPETAFSSLFGWGTPDFDGDLLIDLLYELLTFFGLPVASGIDPGPPPRRFIEFFLAALIPTGPAVDPPGLELLVKFAMAEGFNLNVPVGGGFEFGFGASGALAASAGIRLQPPANLTVIPPQGTAQGSLKAGLDKVPAPGQNRVIMLGVAGATELSAQRIGIRLTTSFAWDVVAGRATGDFGIEGAIEGGKLVISLAGADGFIGSVMGGFGLESHFALGFGWSAGSGVFFTGSGGLEIQIPAHIELGPIEIDNLTFEVGIEAAAFPIGLAATIKAALGPLQAVVENIGVEAVLALPPGGGNVGPFDLSFRFKPPDGIGMSLDVGVVKGGGYLFIDTERGEYAGALEFTIADFLTVAAIGLITTKNPDGSPGFSLLIIITAEFPGGIQLGFGFKLIGVGGLLGLNRTMNLPALMEGVRSGAIESVMFPHDVVANAPRILSDLRAFFPAKQGTFLIGPMVKIGWGTPTLISVSVGVIIEIPGNIAIVGVLQVALPTPEEALVKLQVNFAGAIEFDKQRLYFFASLFDSRILFLTISGEMGLLVAWGDRPEFVLSVGGFHPAFDPPPLPFPSPQRITVSILDEDWGRIRITNYFAVTSNSVQFGAAAELFFGFDSIGIEGHIAFDALFRFSPFYFIVEISASVSLKVFGMGVFSIHLHFALEGTSPWRARGEGSISFFFFDVSADFDETWGEPKHTELDPIDVLPILAAELEKPESWRVFTPPGVTQLVSLRSLPDAGPQALVLHPVGALEVRQRAVPLDLGIAKVGSNRAGDATRFSLSVTGTAFTQGSAVSEPFALAQFLEMDDAAKLSRPSFEPQHAGTELAPAGHGAQSARLAKRVVRFEEVVIDDEFRRRQRRFRPLAGVLFNHFNAGASASLSPLSFATQQLLDPHQDAVAVSGPTYVLASTVDNVATTATFSSETGALQHLDGLLSADPTMKGKVHVIPSFEAVTA